MGSKFLGYTENNGIHRLNFKEKDKEKVYLNSLEIEIFLDNLPSHYNVDLRSATCHSIKEGLQMEHISWQSVGCIIGNIL